MSEIEESKPVDERRLVRRWKCRLFGCDWKIFTPANEFQISTEIGALRCEEACHRCGMRRVVRIMAGMVATGKPYWPNDKTEASPH